VRVADAHTLRLVASECFVTAGRGAAGAVRGSVTLRDDRSFLPRVGVNGSWRLGFPREGCHPLGAALLRHLSLRGARAAVWVGDWLSGLLGAVPPVDDRPNAHWKIRLLPGTRGDFQVSALPVGAATATEVGLLSLKVEAAREPEKPADPAKPAVTAKPAAPDKPATPDKPAAK